MSNTYLLVLLIGVVALTTPSLADHHLPPHYEHIRLAFSPKPAPEHKPPMPVHKPPIEKPAPEPQPPIPSHKPPRKDYGLGHKRFTPAEPPKVEKPVPEHKPTTLPPKPSFLPPIHKPFSPHDHFPAQPSMESGEAPQKPLRKMMPPPIPHKDPPSPYHNAPPPINAY